MRAFTLTPRQVGDVLVLDAVGDLVLCEEIQQIRQTFDQAIEGRDKKILVNMARLQYIDSTGIGMLLALKAATAQRGISLKFCSLPPTVSRLFAQLQFTTLLDVYDQEKPALASFA